MTLVVCKNINGNIRFESDTRIWNELAQKKEQPLAGKLKTIILRRDLCIAYAGNAELAQRAIMEIGSWAGTAPLSTVIETLCDSSKSGVDYIVGSLISPAPRITRVNSGGAEDVESTAWIGDHMAFERFQEYWITHRSDAITPKQQSRLMEHAFDSVIGADLPTVGDFKIRADSKRGYFRYLGYWSIAFPRQLVLPPETVFELGDAARGGYSLSCLHSEIPDRPAVALYFQPGKFGVLLLPTEPFDFVPLHDLDDLQFVDVIASKYGIRLGGLIVRPGGQMLCVGTEPIELGPPKSTIQSHDGNTGSIMVFAKISGENSPDRIWQLPLELHERPTEEARPIPDAAISAVEKAK